jgi:hypothetical protein
MLMGLAVLLLAKPVILTAAEEYDVKTGTPNLVVKLNGSGLVADFLNSGNQSTPQPERIKTSVIKPRTLKSEFFISPVPDVDFSQFTGL